MATNVESPGKPAEPTNKSPVRSRPAFAVPVFGPDFFVAVLPDRVRSKCQGNPDNVPVVNLHLANGRTLDLCHIEHLTDRWMAIQYFRDAETCNDMDVAFLPYDLVIMVTVSVHHSGERPIGFDIQGRTPRLSGQSVGLHPE